MMLKNGGKFTMGSWDPVKINHPTNRPHPSPWTRNGMVNWHPFFKEAFGGQPFQEVGRWCSIYLRKWSERKFLNTSTICAKLDLLQYPRKILCAHIYPIFALYWRLQHLLNLQISHRVSQFQTIQATQSTRQALFQCTTSQSESRPLRCSGSSFPMSSCPNLQMSL